VLKGKQFAHDLVFDAALRSGPGTIAAHVHAKVASRPLAAGGEPTASGHSN